MRFHWFVCLLLASMAFAQTAPSKAAPAQKSTTSATPQKEQPAEADDEGEKEAQPTASTVPPDAPVITIKGICDDTSSSSTVDSSKCETVLTRSQFEKLADAIQPNMPPQVRRQLANAYPRLLVMAHEAKKRGLDKDPRYAQIVQFAQLQILSQELNRSLQQQAGQVPEKDVEDYYKNNGSAYEQATVQRIFVPRTKQVEPAKDAKPDDAKAQQTAGEEAMTKEAEAIHTKAAAGGDFEKLQKEAFDAAGMKSPPPTTKMENIRRTNLPPSQASVFDLKAGEVSAVINDPSGHFIYKMVSKQELPLDKVKDEIHGTLQNQRMKDMMASIQASGTPELNDAYFGPAMPPGPPGMRPGAPSTQPTNKPPSQSK
ncbi:MAG TPA: peptidylprolyl isomerase [Terriglobales bacterium]|nr:peptidylprolyl isomerase [Terriglobales bacterium]